MQGSRWETKLGKEAGAGDGSIVPTPRLQRLVYTWAVGPKRACKDREGTE